MRLRLLFLFLGISAVCMAGEIKFPVKDIPADLLQNADVVVRDKEVKFTINKSDNALYEVHVVYTILNENGKDYSLCVVPYSKLQKVSGFSAYLFDKNGNQLKRLRQSDIYDQSAISNYSLYEDNRIKVADMSYGSFPYTVEFTYTIDYKFLFYIPSFSLVDDWRVAVQHASFTLRYPNEVTPRFKLMNSSIKETQFMDEDGYHIRNWIFDGSKAMVREPLCPPVEEVSPLILVAPTEFKFQAYPGNMGDWNGLGNWIKSLNAGRDKLPESTKQLIRTMTDTIPDVKEKVKVVYKFLQQNTRYVSIQMGIGGFQPFEAEVVDKVGYGDCKALSNYMVALLESININSHYTLINAGEDAHAMVSDFPSSQFNHVVVVVPMKSDSLWLECTSQINPFGYMGSFTGNRKGLAITDDGAKIVNTPVYTQNENTKHTYSEVVVQRSGKAQASVNSSYSGLLYEYGDLYFILNLDQDQKKKWIKEYSAIPHGDILDFSMSSAGDKLPSANIEMNVLFDLMVSSQGKRFFFSPTLSGNRVQVPRQKTKREMDIVYKYGFEQVDSVIYHLPEDLVIDYLPENKQINSDFGTYETILLPGEEGLLFVRKLKIQGGTFPPEKYESLIDFYTSVDKNDKAKVILKSKT